MSAEFVAAAEVKIVELTRQSDALRAEQLGVERQIAGLRQFLGQSSAQTIVQPARKAGQRVIADAAAECLAVDSPVRTSDLVRLLEVRGINFGVFSRDIKLSSILSRDGRFVANRKYGWKLAECKAEV